jgi:hypothetical protein
MFQSGEQTKAAARACGRITALHSLPIRVDVAYDSRSKVHTMAWVCGIRTSVPALKPRGAKVFDNESQRKWGNAVNLAQWSQICVPAASGTNPYPAHYVPAAVGSEQQEHTDRHQPQ